MIKVLFLSTSDSFGGAAKATFKLFVALKKQPLDLRMLVKRKVTRETSVKRVLTFLPMSIHVAWDNFLLNRLSKRKRNYWTLGLLPNFFLLTLVRVLRYDVIQLNWISAGFVPISLIRAIRKPIVWRLSDSWPFTGGCHIPDGCEKYTSGCGSCPQLDSTDAHDISWKTIRRKQRNWNGVNMTIVAPSKWMAANAKRSVVFKDRSVVHIPTGVQTSLFRPLERTNVRVELEFGENIDIILFGAFAATTDPNKGFQYLLKALKKLEEIHPDYQRIRLAVFGNNGEIPTPELKIKVIYLGIISDAEKLNEYYNAADVYVLPSLMENSPNTILESLSAGTPAVGFDACGTAEMIEHKVDGYLAQAYDPDDLAQGLMYFLNRKDRAPEIGDLARQKILKRYDIDQVAKQYNELYKSLVLR